MIRKSLLSLSALLVLAAGVRVAEPDQYLPAETEQVAVINLKQLAGSKLFDKYLKAEVKKALEDNAQFKQLQQVTGGIDIFKDVSSVVVANAGGKGGKALAIIRGNFDLDKITKAAPPLPKNLIYKWFELVDGQPKARYSNKPPASGSYEIVR